MLDRISDRWTLHEACTATSRAASHLTHHHRASPPRANFGPAALLELSDSVRESLARHGNFGPEADQLSFFLELALVEEVMGTPSLDFETVRVARLDKLVADLTVCGEGPFSLAPRFVHDVVTAGKLERKWRARFRADYLMIDEIRLKELSRRWRAPAEPLSNERSSPRPGSATATAALPPVRPNGETGFGAGSYWINLVCARLDGVFGADGETISQADENPSSHILPLLAGKEISAGHDRCEKFSTSEEAMNRLKNGEKFDVVAREMSEDKARSGGSLGWKTKGSLDPQFEEVAFRLSTSSVDNPTYERVKTGFGYHIIMVEDRK
ncbi:hypothetical protein VTH06DRAFT_3914 [Thermothelomyces fergusii]